MSETVAAVQRYREFTLRRARRRYAGTLCSVVGILALVTILGHVYERFLEAQSVEAAEKSDAEQLPGAGPRPVEILAEGADFRVVRHASGVTRIPAHPRRICALASADELLSIGVVPAAHSIKDGNFPDYLEESLRDVPWIPNVYGDAMPNLEAIIAVRPDLIISRAPDRQTYLQLSKIAPVVVLLGHSHHYRQRVLDVGAITGRRREAEARVAWYDAKVRAAREALHTKLQGRTFAFFRVNARSFRLSGWDDSGGPVAFRDLALPRPRLVAENERNITLSPERLIDLDADFAAIAVDVNVGSDRNMRELLEHPAWERLPAARAGHASVLTHYRHWADSGILGKAIIIDDVLRLIAPEAITTVNAQADVALRGSSL